MFPRESCLFLWIFPIIFYLGICTGDLPQTYIALYSPGDPEYIDIIIRRVGDNLTLACELKGDSTPRPYVWNFVSSDNATEDEILYKTEPRGPSLGSRLTKSDLQLTDSGHYLCAAPPYTATKFILVQEKSKRNCAKGAFFCGACVLGTYVCDGFPDCPRGEDEAPALCTPHVCSRPDKLNCSSGRCVSEAACCRPTDTLCHQPTCCDEHTAYRHQGYNEEYPPLFEDRHAPDEYGFIQSTIYTVTACALIFMIAVVLLVSAICKMHMKRAALRSYTQRPVGRIHRFPPCYEASRLLEASRLAPNYALTPGSPQHSALSQCVEEEADGSTSGFGLTRLSSLFNSRYRQVATDCLDVELRAVRASSNPSSPTRPPLPPLPHYRSPTATDLTADYFLHTEVSDCGRDLNYMAGEFIRRNQREPRPLTLQLGRFQLSIPRLGRRASERRPDTPNIAEINIDDLDFVRLNSNETYTLNGRTIRLLGADFENYPMLDTTGPPPYTEAVRYKVYGPPPEYLSRDTLNNETGNTTVTEERARENIEMPPCYDDLNGNVTVLVTNNENNTQSNLVDNGNADNDNGNPVNETETVASSFNDVINDLPAIDDVNANGLDYRVDVNDVTTDNVTSNNDVTNGNEC